MYQSYDLVDSDVLFTNYNFNAKQNFLPLIVQMFEYWEPTYRKYLVSVCYCPNKTDTKSMSAYLKSLMGHQIFCFMLYIWQQKMKKYQLNSRNVACLALFDNWVYKFISKGPTTVNPCNPILKQVRQNLWGHDILMQFIISLN